MRTRLKFYLNTNFLFSLPLGVVIITILSVYHCTFSEQDDFEDQGPEIIFFTISPEKGYQGEFFTFVWETRRAERISIVPNIVDPEFQLPSSGQISVNLMYSNWYTLTAESKEGTISRRAWVETARPDGSCWRFPRRNAMNSAQSLYAGPQKGLVTWKYPTEQWLKQPQLTIGLDESLYISASPETNFTDLYILNPDGTLKYSLEHISNHIISPEGTVYAIETNKQALVALNPNGSKEWELELYPEYTEGCRVFYQLLLREDNKIIVGGYVSGISGIQNADFFLINSDGTLEQRIKPLGGIHGLALRYDNKLISIEKHIQGYIVCRNESLQVIWSVPWSYTDLYGLPVISEENNHTYIRISDGLLAFSPSGEILWKLDGIPILYYTDQMALGLDGSIYVIGKSDRETKGAYAYSELYAIHPEGWIIWQTEIPGLSLLPLALPAPIVDCQGNIYLSTTASVYAYTENGEISWEYNDLSEIFAGLVLSMDGTLYCVGNKSIYAFRDDDRTER